MAGNSLYTSANYHAKSNQMHLYKIEGLRVPVFGREIRGVSCGLHLEFFEVPERLRIAGLIRTDDHERWEALRKIKTLVLINISILQLRTWELH